MKFVFLIIFRRLVQDALLVVQPTFQPFAMEDSTNTESADTTIVLMLEPGEYCNHCRYTVSRSECI